jgi:hypothetical protein
MMILLLRFGSLSVCCCLSVRNPAPDRARKMKMRKGKAQAIAAIDVV